MSKNKKIREYLRKLVLREIERQKEIDEASTTATAGVAPGGPGHYFTPMAFSGGRKKDKKKKKKISTAAGMKPVNESMELKKLEDAILMFQKKIKKQGRVTNARDEDHLKNLIKVYKQMGGRKIKESINEGYGEMMDELEKIYRPSGAPPIAKEALKDLADEYDIGRVLYAARTNEKSFREVLDMKIDQLQSQYVNKKHINTIKRGKKLREGRYHDWRNDESLTPKQKIGKSMREIRDALNELDKTVKMNLKLKNELKMDSRDYWKNTHKALTKISERLVKMANKVGNLK